MEGLYGNLVSHGPPNRSSVKCTRAVAVASFGKSCTEVAIGSLRIQARLS